MSRPVLVRLCVHGTVLVVWLCLSIFCLTTAGGSLARSLPFIAFDSNFAIVYSRGGRDRGPVVRAQGRPG
jgi:hypothetical protein